MYKGYNKIFKGAIIITFSINIGIIKILPSFIGFIIILDGINLLYKETNIEAFNKASFFATIMSISTLMIEGMGFLGIGLSKFFILNQSSIIFFSVIQLLMIYKLFEGSIEYLNTNIDCDLAYENIKKLRYYIIGSVINIILLNFKILFDTTFLNITVIIIFFVVRLYFISSVYNLRKIVSIPPECY